MGEMKTGSMGEAADKVSSTPKKGDSIKSADEAVEDQSVTVKGPSEELSADKELEAKNK